MKTFFRYARHLFCYFLNNFVCVHILSTALLRLWYSYCILEEKNPLTGNKRFDTFNIKPGVLTKFLNTDKLVAVFPQVLPYVRQETTP